jgi:hypothetical protein
LYIDPSTQATVEPAYEAAMLRELDEVVDAVPPERLAIQWDTAVEFAMLEGVFSAWIPDRQDGIPDRLTRFAAAVPGQIPFGFTSATATVTTAISPNRRTPSGSSRSPGV